MKSHLTLVEHHQASSSWRDLLSSQQEIAALFGGLKPLSAWINEKPRSKEEIEERQSFEPGLRELEDWIAEEIFALAKPAKTHNVVPLRTPMATTVMKEVGDVISTYYAKALVDAISDLPDAEEELHALRVQVGDILADLDQVRQLYAKAPCASGHLDLYELFVNMLREIEDLLQCQS